MPESPTSLPVNLHDAIMQLQANLPTIGKNNEADTGKYKYKYASLPEVNELLLPLLSSLGLTWTTAPTTQDGRAVLHYELSHYEGDSVEGYYPLGSPDQTPQAIGSAITYARRYALLAITGVAPDDDDGKLASAAPEMPLLQDPPKDWRKKVDAVTDLVALQSLYEFEASQWFTEEVKLAFTARKIALGG